MNEVDFEKLAWEYAAARDSLGEKVNDLETEIARMKRQRLPAIRRAVDTAAQKGQALHDAVKAHPDRFKKPRTKVMHGIRFGYQKEKGKLTWTDEEKVIALIKKHFPEDLEFLIKTEEKPLKKALEKLSAADLKKLGITVGEDEDVIVIRSMDSEIDKIVSALLDTEEDEEELAGVNL